MATVKYVSGSYTINSQLVTINGNLVVTGNSTSINTTDTSIWDNIITLNGNLASNVAPTLNAAIEVNRGSSANVALRWNESVDAWQITNDGATYSNIATSTGSGGMTISANLDMNGYTIYTTTRANVTIDTNLAIKSTSVSPPGVTGYNVLSSQTVGGGGSGLYFNNNVVSGELASKSAAVKYSIIFG